ncbi:uncharacterized protein LOC110063935 [Orbicella faveolata]|uniref:uncharacterized protein LOC110063935 n=1 Tax=Orbicella faveolata TaxID=48498 RepID=UPI0009E2A125|nr:uncharacterized protein LOC110063935 [Orbicella faveolata]
MENPFKAIKHAVQLKLLLFVRRQNWLSLFLLLDHALARHITNTVVVVDEFQCQLNCFQNNGCKSFNVYPDGNNAQRQVCELNNKTRQMKPGDFKWKKGSTYYGSVQVTQNVYVRPVIRLSHHFPAVSFIDVSREQNEQNKSGQCHPGYKGKRCETAITGLISTQPAHSCKDIRDSGDSKGDGEYWIDPEKSGNPLKSPVALFGHVITHLCLVSGGWLLVSYFVIDSSSSQLQLSIETSYRGISKYHNNQTFLTKSAMNELRTHLSFNQLRFHCSKQQGRTFHVTTVANSTGEAVVQYFSGQTDIQPDACYSFVRMRNDNSRLAGVCGQWGFNGTNYNVGKWGHARDQDRLYYYPAFQVFAYHWVLIPHEPRWDCDDGVAGVSSGDFWKVFVR